MSNDMDKTQQPIYSHLLLFWLAMLINFIRSMLPLGATFSSLASIVLSLASLYAVFRMHRVSKRMNQAWLTKIIAVLLSILVMVPSFLLLRSSVGLRTLFLILPIWATSIMSLVAEYFFYSALDELVTQRGYAFPKGGILWCFWLAILFGVFIGLFGSASPIKMPAALSTGLTAAQNVITLILLGLYLWAVKAREAAPD